MKFTLNDILVKRDEALADVRKSGKRIKTLTGNLFEPPKATGRFGGLINNFDRVVAVYEGGMHGKQIIGSGSQLFCRCCFSRYFRVVSLRLTTNARSRQRNSPKNNVPRRFPKGWCSIP